MRATANKLKHAREEGSQIQRVPQGSDFMVSPLHSLKEHLKISLLSLQSLLNTMVNAKEVSNGIPSC
jgi:hypothetical protein